jgi:hypothetical protein
MAMARDIAARVAAAILPARCDRLRSQARRIMAGRLALETRMTERQGATARKRARPVIARRRSWFQG